VYGGRYLGNGRVYGGYRPYYRGYYGRRYPYYGGAVAAGLIGGLALGALSYPYDGGYPYDDGYYDYGYYDGGPYGVGDPYAGVAAWPPCLQGPPLCTAAGYPNLSYLRRYQGAPF
jgi:hypothetical protein